MCDRLLNFDLDSHLVSSSELYLDANGEYLVNDHNNWLNLDFTYYRYVQVWYTKSIRTLLPHPYETRCKNFKLSTPYLSRMDCIRRCMIQQYSESNANVWPLNVPVPSNLSVIQKNVLKGECRALAHSSNQCHVVKNVKNVEQFCIEHCENRDDCYQESFVLSDSQRVPRFSKLDTSEIELLVQKGLEQNSVMQPKLDIFEFYSYIASTVSLWFGISVLALTHNRYVKILHAKLNTIAERTATH